MLISNGFPGKNIPNDLHIEHLCLIKTALQGLEVNKIEKDITSNSNEEHQTEFSFFDAILHSSTTLLVIAAIENPLQEKLSINNT